MALLFFDNNIDVVKFQDCPHNLGGLAKRRGVLNAEVHTTTPSLRVPLPIEGEFVVWIDALWAVCGLTPRRN